MGRALRANDIQCMSCPFHLAILVGISLSIQGCMESAPECPPFSKFDGQVCVGQDHCIAAPIGHGEVSATAKGEEGVVLCDDGFAYSGPKLACIELDKVCRIDEKRSVCSRLFKYRRKSLKCEDLGTEPYCQVVLGFGKPGSGYKEASTEEGSADVPVVPEGDKLAAEVVLDETTKLLDAHIEGLSTSYECVPVTSKGKAPETTAAPEATAAPATTAAPSGNETQSKGPASEAKFLIGERVVHNILEGTKWPLGVSMSVGFFMTAILLCTTLRRHTMPNMPTPASRDMELTPISNVLDDDDNDTRVNNDTRVWQVSR